MSSPSLGKSPIIPLSKLQWVAGVLDLKVICNGLAAFWHVVQYKIDYDHLFATLSWTPVFPLSSISTKLSEHGTSFLGDSQLHRMEESTDEYVMS